MVNLLSPNDLDQLSRAMASGREISLTRTLSDFTITASTTRAVPVWECDMLVRLEQTCGNVYRGADRQVKKRVPDLYAVQ